MSPVYRLINILTTSDLGSESNPAFVYHTNGLCTTIDAVRCTSIAAIKSKPGLSVGYANQLGRRSPVDSPLGVRLLFTHSGVIGGMG
jgi:hypothetical protein